MVDVTLVKPNVMQKLGGKNIIIKLKVQNHQNNIKQQLRNNISHYFTMGCHFKCSKKAKTKKIWKHHILLSGNLILKKKRTLKDWSYLEMVSHKTINDIMQTPKKEVHFLFFFSVCCIVFNCS